MGDTYARSSMGVMKLSVIINNYNYGPFVGQAIESALAIDWLDKETIVVDDGSTDDSRKVIESFGERIAAIFTANSGQARAMNVGFERSTGDVVIFLDADDLLLPTVAQQVMSVWHPGVAKVQYGLIYVDQALRPLGRCWPAYTEKNTPESILQLMRKTGDYLSSPTSGNAWSRDFLSEVFPIPTREEGLHWIDMYLHKLAPFFGDVLSLTTPHCLYRRHGNNVSSSVSTERYIHLLNQVKITDRFACKLLQKKNRATSISNDNEYYTKLCLLAKRFFPSRYPVSTARLLLRYWRTVLRGEFSAKKKTFFVLWSVGVVAAPRPLAGWITLNREGHHTIGHAGPISTCLRRVLVNVFDDG
jgi:glycosyltransferase involved in cell wall biosynthesis